MFISLRIKNFRSILDTTISSTYEEGKAPNNYKEFPRLPFLEDSKHRLVPCLAIYGANAGGKSNVIKAFFALNRLLSFGVKAAFDPNKLFPNQKTTCFEAKILLNHSTYDYCVEYSEESIVYESLVCGKQNVFEIRNSTQTQFKRITSETYTEKNLKDFLRVECSDKEGKHNRPFLSLIGTKYPGLNRDIADVSEFILKSVFISLNNQIPIGLGIKMLDSSLENFGKKETAFDKLQTIIAKLDFGIQRLEINRTKLEQNQSGQYSLPIDSQQGNPISIRHDREGNFAEYLYSYHEDEQGNEIRFNFQEESTGTQIALGILGSILAALEKGGIVLIDELDRSLHSLVFQLIVQLFTNKRYNTKNAQLIFTAHNTDLLDADVLRVSEIGFVNKTSKNGTTFQRLVEFDGVRNGSDFRRRYLSGEFDGIPFPYL